MNFGLVNLFAGIMVFSSGLPIWFYDGNSKSKYNKKKQSKFGSIIIFISGLILIISGILSQIFYMPFYGFIVSWILYTLIIVCGMIYIYTSSRFKK